MLLRALRLTTWYTDSGLKVAEEDEGLSKEELVMGKLLHKIRLIKDMNAHPIWGVELNPRDPTNVGTENIGQGLYTAIASFFNSDCNPNTIRINMGTQMFLVASKNIRKGEEITDNYCIHFSDVTAGERQGWIEVQSTEEINMTESLFNIFRTISSLSASARRVKMTGQPTAA